MKESASMSSSFLQASALISHSVGNGLWGNTWIAGSEEEEDEVTGKRRQTGWIKSVGQSDGQMHFPSWHSAPKLHLTLVHGSVDAEVAIDRVKRRERNNGWQRIKNDSQRLWRISGSRKDKKRLAAKQRGHERETTTFTLHELDCLFSLSDVTFSLLELFYCLLNLCVVREHFFFFFLPHHLFMITHKCPLCVFSSVHSCRQDSLSHFLPMHSFFSTILHAALFFFLSSSFPSFDLLRLSLEGQETDSSLSQQKWQQQKV
jgi:hypothetical protein